MYDDPSDDNCYKEVIYGAHLIPPFQCDICVFCTILKKDPRRCYDDKQNLARISRMKLYEMRSWETSTIDANMINLNNFITTCKYSGFDPQLLYIGPLPFEDVFGLSVDFSMLQQYSRPWSHISAYT